MQFHFDGFRPGDPRVSVANPHAPLHLSLIHISEPTRPY